MPGDRRKAGRKPVQIDLTELEKLCSLHCTDAELADWFGVSTRTIETRRKRPEFAQAKQRGRSKGQVSVRGAPLAAAGFNVSVCLLGPRSDQTFDLLDQPFQVLLLLILTRHSLFDREFPNCSADLSELAFHQLANFSRVRSL